MVFCNNFAPNQEREHKIVIFVLYTKGYFTDENGF